MVCLGLYFSLLVLLMRVRSFFMAMVIIGNVWFREEMNISRGQNLLLGCWVKNFLMTERPSYTSDFQETVSGHKVSKCWIKWILVILSLFQVILGHFACVLSLLSRYMTSTFSWAQELISISPRSHLIGDIIDKVFHVMWSALDRWCEEDACIIINLPLISPPALKKICQHCWNWKYVNMSVLLVMINIGVNERYRMSLIHIIRVFSKPKKWFKE